MHLKGLYGPYSGHGSQLRIAYVGCLELLCPQSKTVFIMENVQWLLSNCWHSRLGKRVTTRIRDDHSRRRPLRDCWAKEARKVELLLSTTIVKHHDRCCTYKNRSIMLFQNVSEASRAVKVKVRGIYCAGLCLVVISCHTHLLACDWQMSFPEVRDILWHLRRNIYRTIR